MNKFKLVVSRILAERKKKLLTPNLPDIVSETMFTTSMASAEDIEPRSTQFSSLDIVQNYRLVWLDVSDHEGNKDHFENIISQLREIVNSINTFTDANQCLNWITNIKNETVFMIFSGVFDQNTMATVHNSPQVSSVYIIHQKEENDEQFGKQWFKIKGIFKEVSLSFCELLRQDVYEYDRNFISSSLISTDNHMEGQELNFVDPSFVYSQVIEELLSKVDFNQQHLIDLIQYCREQFIGNVSILQKIATFSNEYQQHAPVWWYTRSRFLHSMLNRAFNNMEIKILFRMGFLIRDLHENIVQLHTEQYRNDRQVNVFQVYRGQGVSLTVFDQLRDTKDGFISFNNFLNASKDRDFALRQARQNMTNPNLMGILFVMVIDPTETSTAFADIQSRIGDQNTDEQMIFTRNSVFRIKKIEQIDMNNDRLWQVELALTRNDDPQFCQLIDYIHDETFPRKKGWHRLGRSLIKFEQFDKAQQLYELLLSRTSDDHEKADIYHMLGWIKDSQEEYPDAISFYEKSIEIKNATYSTPHLDLASSYNNIGGVYDQMGDYSKALSAHHKALEIREDILPHNHPDLAISYNNIAGVYSNMDSCSSALFFYIKALEICQHVLPLNLPYLATSYNNIALAYETMENYTSALHFHEKALEIRRKLFPSNQIELAQSYNNIAGVYENLGNYWQALEFYEHALDILQCLVPASHPNLRRLRKSIELVKREF